MNVFAVILAVILIGLSAYEVYGLVRAIKKRKQAKLDKQNKSNVD